MNQIFERERAGKPNGRGRHNLILILLVIGGGVALVLGWRLFWFMTDDAYIAFRYISNSYAGYGYTWNLPPFRPVEGYTSFLWLFLLDVLWRLTGFSPPSTANIVALLFALGSLFLGMAMVWRLRLRPELERLRPWFLLFFLVVVLTNRTFLTWSSSGLETAMFNFFVLAWLAAVLYLQAGTPLWVLGMVTTAVLAALSRPDGLLLIAASVFLGGFACWRWWQKGWFRRHYLAAWLPLLLTGIHFLWRKSKYGEWLPNTFAAKYVTPWPASGWRYLLSFILEYALWFWLLLVVMVAVKHGRLLFRRRAYRWSEAAPSAAAPFAAAPPRLLLVLTVTATLLTHFFYYTFIIGGDYFEYRVYSHLLIPMYGSFIWLLNQLTMRPQATAVLCLLYLPLSWLIPWTHWQEAQTIINTPSGFARQAAIAGRFPRLIRPYAAGFDAMQEWMIERQVGVRYHQHRAFFERQVDLYPTRQVGASLAADQFPVVVLEAVGVPGWMLPTTNIIDAHGLNDYVVARNPVAPEAERTMAHDRFLPVGYADCFTPNVRVVRPGRVLIHPRVLEPDTIVACETAVWPASRADEVEVSSLGIDHRRTPALDHFLWHSGPPDLLMMTYLPPAAGSRELNAHLLQVYPSFAGTGCLVIPPQAARQDHSEFLFAFFAPDEPLTAQARALFPWWQPSMPEVADPMPHFGYTAVAGPEAAPTPAIPHSASWTNHLTLLGYDLTQTAVKPGEKLNLTLYLRVEAPVENVYSQFTHLSGDAFNPATGGPLWGQQDGSPCGDFYAMADWQPGTIVLSKVSIPIPPEAPAGVYQLQTGFYNWMSGERIPVANGSGDTVPLSTVQIEAPE